MAIIDKPSDYFNTVLYTGNASASRSITGVGFQPDWVWVKGRSTGYYHGLWDSVRTNKSALYSNATDAEDTTTGGTLTSFDSDGFTLPNVSGGFVNNNGTTYASWNWLAGGTASSNTDGSITSSVSANQDAGFSIVSFDLTSLTGNKTVGHGLNTAPKVVITKRRSGGAGDWTSYFGAIGNSYLVLNSSNASATSSSFMNNTAPTSSVFTVGDPSWWGANPFIAYCFAEKQGFSKFGSYTGNGSTDGTFVYTGFKPAMIIAKQSSGGQAWQIHDTARDTFNLATRVLFPNSSSAEQNSSANGALDILSNGFKWRMADADQNGSGSTYIYMAFAENPFVTSTGVPATAR